MAKTLKDILIHFQSLPRITIENFIDQCKNGEFKPNGLKDTLNMCCEAIDNFFKDEQRREKYARKEHNFPEYMTAREYLTYVFNIVDLANIKTHEAKLLKSLLDMAEDALGRHIIVTPVNSLKGGFTCKLRLSKYESNKVARGIKGFLGVKSAYLFPREAFDTELRMAGFVSCSHLVTEKDEVYKMFLALPPAIKTLYFSRVYPGNKELDPDDVPFALIKHLFEYTTEERWNDIMFANRRLSKVDFSQYLTNYVRNFVDYEIENHQIYIGYASQSVRDKTKKGSHKEQAIAQFIKPLRWIARRNHDK